MSRLDFDRFVIRSAEVERVGHQDTGSSEASTAAHHVPPAETNLGTRVRRSALGVLTSVALVGLAGCAQLIPGMNIHIGGAGQHVSGADEGNSSPAARALLRYRVIPITPQIVASILTHPHPSVIAPSGAPPLEPLLPTMVPSEYRVGPGDVIDITVWDHPELTLPTTILSQNPVFNGQLVAANGTIYYPFVGTFKAAGMTVQQLREYLADHLRRVIQRPQVGVRVVSFDSKRVEITGEVNRPGTIALNNIPEGLLQAIDSAGGLAAGASRRRVILVRHGFRYEIDLADLLSGNRIVSNPELMPGDIIHVPDQSVDQVFMLGAVARQEPLVMTQNSMTLTQALTDAGGLDNTRASGSGVLVFRLPAKTTPHAEADVYTIDMSTPQGVLLASEFPLQSRDVVYVAATEFAQYNAVINELLPTITSIFELHQLGAL